MRWVYVLRCRVRACLVQDALAVALSLSASSGFVIVPATLQVAEGQLQVAV